MRLPSLARSWTIAQWYALLPFAVLLERGFAHSIAFVVFRLLTDLPCASQGHRCNVVRQSVKLLALQSDLTAVPVPTTTKNQRSCLSSEQVTHSMLLPSPTPSDLTTPPK